MEFLSRRADTNVVTTSRPARRFGVEEEYLLLDAETGLPRDAAEELEGAVPHLAVEHEFFKSQLETATPVCSSAREAEDFLRDFRAGVSEAAAARGIVLAGTGLPPLGGDIRGTVTENTRYLGIAADMGRMVSHYYSTGTHVHVEVPSRDVGVEVMARLTRWSPVLVALTANSPIWLGEATGFASWRFLSVQQWPTAGYPPCFADGAEYERVVERFVRSGVLLDSGLVNWVVRLSERYPTVELRTADAQLTPEDATAFAVIVRALADCFEDEVEAGEPRPDSHLGMERAAHWMAAKHGLSGELLDPVTDEPRPAFEVVDALVDYAREALARAGDLELVEAYVARRRADGGPARLQSLRYEESGIGGLLELYRSGSTGAR